MFHYEQNASLSHIHQQERIDEGERSRLAADAKPPTRSYGALFASAPPNLTALEHALQAQPKQPEPRTSTQEVAAVP